MLIKIGTRASRLALIQARIVANKIPFECEIVPIKTSGDLEISKPLYDLGGKALFIKELEDALLTGKIDIAVHSLKDVPGILPQEFTLGAVLEREDPREVLISKSASSISELPLGAVVGTSSPRRIAYLKHIRPDIKIVNIRGNVETRFSKVFNNEIDATILAYAGLKRLGMIDNELCKIISPEEIIPAIGQGAISIEVLKSRKEEFIDIFNILNHKQTSDMIVSERAFLEHLNADCKTPAAAYARLNGPEEMIIDFMLADDKMENLKTSQVICSIENAYNVGMKTAKKLSTS
ncbi:MAG: porphobilinogen deaminase [Pseudomonadota bacterium]|jgi:hydroxymethylbilane synthase